MLKGRHHPPSGGCHSRELVKTKDFEISVFLLALFGVDMPSVVCIILRTSFVGLVCES